MVVEVVAVSRRVVVGLAGVVGSMVVAGGEVATVVSGGDTVGVLLANEN